MRIALKTTGDIEKVRKIIESSKTYFYKAHVEISGNTLYVVFDVLERR